MDGPHFAACHGRRPAPLVAVIGIYACAQSFMVTMVPPVVVYLYLFPARVNKVNTAVATKTYKKREGERGTNDARGGQRVRGEI